MDTVKVKELEFGTAGLRGIMGDGTDEMNAKNVRRAAHSLCKLIINKNPLAKIAIAFDTRNNSRYFAKEAALAAAGLGVCVYLFEKCMPTPVLSYAIRKLGCDSGIVITASHNTKEYNGFKAYDNTGCQLGVDESEKVSEIYRSIDDAPCMDEEKAVRLELLKYVGDSVVDDYLEEMNKISYSSPKSRVSVVYSPLHGTGAGVVDRLISLKDYVNLHTVAEQFLQDGDFPTLITPNPEDDEGLSLSLKLAKEKNADIILATDPDCDRVGVVVRHGGEYIKLTGNQLGSLLTEYILSHESRGKYIVKSVVSDDLSREIAKKYGVEVIETLTGFKYIGEKMNENAPYRRLALAFEESCGYLVHELTRDKDGVGTSALICEMAAYYLDKNMTLIDALEKISRECGYFIEYKISAKTETLMQELRVKKASAMPGTEYKDYVNGIDGLPSSNMIKYIYPNGSWIAVRPSGTEPKVKIYCSVRGKTRAEVENMLESIKKEELLKQFL